MSEEVVAEFNLLEEKWIRVLRSNYIVKEVSLVDALIDAHTYKDLAGELKGQDVAVLRLMLAVLHTVFSRVDIGGNLKPIERGVDARERWKTLWNKKKFPKEPILKYLKGYRDKFYLFHPIDPFYQVPEAIKGATFKASKLNGTLSESKRKVRLFSVRSGDLRNTLTYPEAARWILYLNGYDDTSSKEFGGELPKIGWLGEIGIVTAVGNNLFETLMLNLAFLKDGEKLWGDNSPIWEQKKRTKVTNEIPPPDNPAELLTLQSRRIILNREEKKKSVVGYHAQGGDFFSKENAFSEQMTIWGKKKNDSNKYLPKQHDGTSQVWREFNALISQAKNSHSPGIVKWLEELQNQEILSDDVVICLRLTFAQYNSSRRSVITDEFGDSLSFSAALLTEKEASWQIWIIEEIKRCERRSNSVGNLAKDLVRAAGGSKNQADTQSERERGNFFYQLDIPFRKWLRSLEPGQDRQVQDEKRREWTGKVGKIARRLGKDMVEKAGITAFVGRYVTKSTGGKKEGKKKTLYCAPKAFNKFLCQMAKIEKEG